MKKSKMNVKLLRKIQKLFREKPSKSYMGGYARLKDKHMDKFTAGEEVPFCNTHLCIAGAALCISGAAKMRYDQMDGVLFVNAKTNRKIADEEDNARKLLGLTPIQSYRLFHEDEWSEKFWSDDSQRGSRTLAKNMVARIEHLIKTGE